MTWDYLKASGSGRIVLALEIAGWPYVFTSYPWTPDDDWYTDAGYEGALDWLIPQGIELADSIRPLEGFGDTPGITFTIADVDGGLTALHRDYTARVWTRLATSLDRYATEVEVLDATGFRALSGVIWIGQEAIRYVYRDASTFFGCTRGYYSTIPRDYPTNFALEPPVSAVVADGPVDIRGRPCRLHVAEVTDGVVGKTTIIYRGFVGQDIDLGEAAWVVKIEHCSVVFDRRIGADLPSTALRPGYFYTGDPSSVSVVGYQQVGSGGSGVTFRVVTSGFYSNAESLARIWNEAAKALGSTIKPQVYRVGNKWGLYAPANTAVNLAVTCRYGDPLWALGFEPGTMIQDRNVEWRREADEEPRPVVVDWTDGYSPIVAVDDPEPIITGLYVSIPGHPFSRVYAKIDETIVLLSYSQDVVRKETIWTVEENTPEKMRISHVFAFSGDPNDPDTLTDAIRRALWLLPGQPEPERWCAWGLTTDDLNFDELTAAFVGAPTELSFCYDSITKGMSFKDIFGPRLGVLGVAPRITTGGSIGWVRIETPIELAANEVPVDDEVWSVIEASQVRSRLSGDPLVTQVRVLTGFDYRSDEWPPRPSEVNWDDGIATRAQVRSMSYDLRGIAYSDKLAHLPSTIPALEGVLRTWLTAFHYGLYGRLSADFVIPVTWTGKQFRCGDVVKITHPLLPDVTEGQIGVAERLGFVVGVRHAVTDDGPDQLTVKIPPRSYAGGIGPCALATGWDPGTYTLAFPDAGSPRYAQHGRNDLDEFYPGMIGTLWEYDVYRPSVGWPLTVNVVSVDTVTNTVVIDANPFPGWIFPTYGVWLTFGEWLDQQQQDRLFVSIADTSYTLGSGDPGFAWAV